MESDQKIKSTGLQVAKLKKGKTVEYKNPVAQERADIMKLHYGYVPLIADVFTLKPNIYYEHN